VHGKKEGTQLLFEKFAGTRLSFVVQCSFGPVCVMCTYVCICVRVCACVMSAGVHIRV